MSGEVPPGVRCILQLVSRIGPLGVGRARGKQLMSGVGLLGVKIMEAIGYKCREEVYSMSGKGSNWCKE